jgi:hypothetical protein
MVLFIEETKGLTLGEIIPNRIPISEYLQHIDLYLLVGIFSALVIEHVFFRGQAEKEEKLEEEEEAHGEEALPVQPDDDSG